MEQLLPRVSVAVPNYNYARFLSWCIESILEREVRNPGPIPPQGDRLGLSEIAALCGPVSEHELTRAISGRELLPMVLKRWMKRLLGSGNHKGKK